MADTMDEFLATRPVAVVGASNDRRKYGNIILRDLRGRGWEVYAINPKESEVEGEPAYATLGECPTTPGLAVMVVPPPITRQVLDEAKGAGVNKIWFQDGSYSNATLKRAGELGLEVIHGACIMVMAARRP